MENGTMDNGLKPIVCDKFYVDFYIFKFLICSKKLLIAILTLLIIIPMPLCWAATPTIEPTILTESLLQEKINSPVLVNGVSTVDLTNFIIDLTDENADFRQYFYQQLQSAFNRSKTPLGLNLSQSVITGDFLASKLGISTALSQASLSSLLTPIEQEKLTIENYFPQPGEQIPSIIVFRGLMKLHGTSFTGKVDFDKMFFLQQLDANDANFVLNANFNNTRFARLADFSKAIFGSDTNFNYSYFLDKVRFSQAIFRGAANFTRSSFSMANFHQAEFVQVADFTSSQWLQTADLSNVNFGDRLLFSKSIFYINLSLVGATFEKAVTFREVSFAALVNFQDVKLLDQIDFSNAIFTPSATLNIAGFAFDSQQAKIIGDTGVIGKVASLPKLEGNETVVRNLVQNFREQEQIPDANLIEYKSKILNLQAIAQEILTTPIRQILSFSWFKNVVDFLTLSLLLLLSNYGTDFNLVLGVGIVTTSYFGLLFWLIDRWRRRYPSPILPSRYETITMVSSFLILTAFGIADIFQTSETPWISLSCLALILLPFPLVLLIILYRKGRYHRLLDITYFMEDGSERKLRLLIVRLPIMPRFPFFRDRYLPILWDRRWNWLNYYDFSLNNMIKLGFNDLRLRDEYLPGIVSTLVWYQWSLGILYVALLFWTLSRTIPGLNLLIYLK